MSVEIIGKLVPKNNGTFKLVDADKVDYDGNNSVKDKIEAHEFQLNLKASQSYVDSKLAGIVNGNGINNVYPTLSDLEAKYPTGATGIFVIQSDGNWYWWNGVKWDVGGKYLSGGDSNSELSPFENIYIKDQNNNEIYQLYCNNGVIKSRNTSLSAKRLFSISATKTKTVYDMDEKILVDDIVVMATYADGSSSSVTGWQSNIDELDTFTEGLRKLIITYTLDDITKSTIVYISVRLSVSYDSKQYVRVVNETGNLTNDTELAKSIEKISNRDNLNIRFRLRILITKNTNTGYTTIGLGNLTYWNTTAIKSILLTPNTVGEFLIEGNFNVIFPTANLLAGAPLLKLYNSSSSVEGKFVLEQLSVALISPAAVILSSISATKTTLKYFASDIINTNDITVTAKYSDDTSANVTNFVTNVQELDLTKYGDTPLTVSYTEAGVTKTTTITLKIYKADYTEPQPFNLLSAQDVANEFTFGWNLGNNLDSKPSSDFGEDKYLNQETAWGQPIIKKATFDLIKSLGFNTVRIPVTWFYNSYIDAEGNRRIGTFWMARVREVIDYALECGFWVILNSHHDMSMFYAGVSSTTFSKISKDIVSVWSDIANKFKHYGDKLIFESFNEVDNIQASWSYSELSSQQMNQMNQLFVNTVRNTGSNNANRILIVPTLLDGTTSNIYDTFIMPTDTVSNKIMVEVHTYPTIFLQNLEPTFEAMENFSKRINAPVIVGEFGTTNITFSDQRIRPIHASNFIARAKYHNIKAIWWDNGTTASSPSDYAVINRFTNTVKYGNIIDAINNGYNNNIAYQIPDELIYTVNSIDKVVYLNLSKDTGVVSNTYWGSLTTDFIPVIEGNTLTTMVTREGAATVDQIALANIVFYDVNQDYISGIATAYQTLSYNTVVPAGAAFARVSCNSPSKNVTQANYTTYLSDGILELTIQNYSIDVITPVDLGAELILSNIFVSKDVISYNVEDVVSIDDVIVTAKYTNGMSKVVTSWISNYDVIDFTTEGDKILTITYTESGVTISKDITITMTVIPSITYEWNGEENLPVGLTLSSGEGGTTLTQTLGVDGKYYYSYNSTTYGYGSISLVNSVRPTTGTTEITATLDVLSIVAGTNIYGNIVAYVSDTRIGLLSIRSSDYYSASVSGLPTLGIGEHILKIVVYQSTNTYDVYVDNVKYGTAISQWNASSATSPTCGVRLWHYGKDKIILKSFKYKHIEN